MSGIGSPCLTCIPFDVSKMEVGNGRFLAHKYGERRKVRAESGMNDSQGGNGKCIFPELTIKNIPYTNEVVKRQSQKLDSLRRTESDLSYVEEAYESCRLFCAERDKTAELGFRLLSKPYQRACWALYAWGRRIDDLVDSNYAAHIRSRHVDEWELRTEDIFNGHPHDILDVALIDTISKFSGQFDIKIFQELLKGMRMDTLKDRYANFEELFLYCYYVAGIAGFGFVRFLGISPESTMSSETICEGLVHVFIAVQLTDIIQDVSLDAQAGKVYLPQDELATFGLSDEDIFSRKVTDEWRAFTKMQIERARSYYKNAEEFIAQLDKANRGMVLALMVAQKTVLDEIEANDYDNLTKKQER